MKNADVANRIKELKKKQNAVLIAHNYQIGEVQDVADFVGDSLELSQKAAQIEADIKVTKMENIELGGRLKEYALG